MAALTPFEARFESAQITVRDDTLTISTGRVQRQWQWTGQGFATIRFGHAATGREWIQSEPNQLCDWGWPGLTGDASLTRLAVRESDDEGFTSPHLEAIATMEYSEARVGVQYVIWAYPDAPGFRTQLRVQAKTGYVSAHETAGHAEHLSISADDRPWRAIGYYSDTQHRNTPQTEILREEALDSLSGNGECDWASVLALGSAKAGILLVKESHKCPNTPNGGANTGGFVWDEQGVRVTGLGWLPEDFTPDRYRACWANWSLLYDGDADAVAMALKTFDGFRYPIDPRRDLYTMANTWGSSDSKQAAQPRATESNVLNEISSQADLGIDVQQIDDGWQGEFYEQWQPARARYPQGWRNVVAAAEEQGVTLGLWAAHGISAEDLIWNHDQGGFRYFKIDFAHLGKMAQVEQLMAKARELVLHSGHTVRINWDVTERAPRVGYFFGREYGNIYLENRNPVKPEHVVYRPALVLRDAWQLAHYMNLSKFQIPVQNVERVNPGASDAHRHGHAYCVAITLMGSPIFFQETQYYGDAARDEIRPLLALYKRHRAEIFRGTVWPIGDKPDNQSWTGFQCHLPEGGCGHVLLFRERENGDGRKSIPLRFLDGRAIQWTDLRADETITPLVSKEQGLDVTIESPADFRWLRYEVLG